jgi:hypothetical protein
VGIVLFTYAPKTLALERHKPCILSSCAAL